MWMLKELVSITQLWLLFKLFFSQQLLHFTILLICACKLYKKEEERIPVL